MRDLDMTFKLWPFVGTSLALALVSYFLYPLSWWLIMLPMIVWGGLFLILILFLAMMAILLIGCLGTKFK